MHAVGWFTTTLFLTLFTTTFSHTAWAQLAVDDPDHVSFTLEGCRDQTGYNPDAMPADLVCDDAGYTTGNLGKLWNELDLVPHRITSKAGNAAPDTQTFRVAITLDNWDGGDKSAMPPTGHPGYDVISAPVLNTALSDSSCTAAMSSAQMELHPGVGGTDYSIYRLLDITQDKNTTCVYDYYGRLAVGAHLYPGSSLHANLMNQAFGTAGIGAKDVSIPVNEIEPQTLAKDMTASSGVGCTWAVSKGADKNSLEFGNVCAENAPTELGLKVTVKWVKTETAGGVDALVFIYVGNPAARSIDVSVTDDIFKGMTPTGMSIDNHIFTGTVGPNSTLTLPDDKGYAVHWDPAAMVGNVGDYLSDKATATYTDKITGVPVPGQTEATDYAQITQASSEGCTATVTDNESMDGDYLTFSVASPMPGMFVANKDGDTYAANAKVPSSVFPGPVAWSSGVQSDSSYVDFDKTVYLSDPSHTYCSNDPTKSCSTDADCGMGNTCDPTSRVITKGTLSDTAMITYAVPPYCSDDPMQSCETDADCSAEATCENTVSKSASFSAAISSTATVSVDVTKTIPAGILNAGDQMDVYIDVFKPNEFVCSNDATQSCSTDTDCGMGTCDVPKAQEVKLTFVGGGSTSQSTTVTGDPGMYNAKETKCEFYASGSSTPAACDLSPVSPTASDNVVLPVCDGALTFVNRVPEERVAHARVNKITAPVTDEADDWYFTLSCDGYEDEIIPIPANKAHCSNDSTQSCSTDADCGMGNTCDPTLYPFQTDIITDTECTVTETQKGLPWVLDSATPNDGKDTKVCYFEVNFPGASLFYDCTFHNTKQGRAKVVKTVTVDGVTAPPSSGQAFTFQLRQGASTTALGTILESKVADSTNNGMIMFDAYLVPTQHYQLCELVRAGWNTNLDGGLFVPGSIIPPNLPNPDVDNLPVCTDFVAQAGVTTEFKVDNTPPPGGRALTPGYWKNWTACSNGNQDDVLGPTLLMIPDSEFVGTRQANMLDCPDATDFLDKRRLASCGEGKAKNYYNQKLASDPAWNSASPLLAYYLNRASEAYTCGKAVSAANNVQTILYNSNFDGCEHDNLSKAQKSALLDGAKVLDLYNNNMLDCSD